MATLTFIGAGNVAWHLAQAFEDAGHTISEVYSRQPGRAASLVRHLYDARPVASLDFSRSNADIFFIAVPDDAVAAVCQAAVFPAGAVVCHTSGTLPLDALKSLSRRGVFYPLQTFSSGRPLDVRQVPFCLEAADAHTEQRLVALAQSISGTVYLVSSEERQVLHVGAVVAGNFTNHLLALAKRIVEKEGLEFDLLKPLIAETVAKALAAPDPAQVQTGPARRHDAQTVARHLHYLAGQPQVAKLYKLLTQSIQATDPAP